MLMHARNIPKIMELYRDLGADLCIFTAHTEVQLMEAIPRIIQGTDYDRYVLSSDDLVPDPVGWEYLERSMERHEITTGWCQIDQRYRPNLANVTKGPIPAFGDPSSRIEGVTPPPVFAGSPGPHPLRVQPVPRAESYDWYRIDQLRGRAGETLRTWFTGFSMSAMSREMWLRYPFQTIRGIGRFDGGMSDYALSWRLQQDGIPIMFDPGSYFLHLAHHADYLIGKVPPRVDLEPHG